MNELHADPQSNDVATDQATTSGSYTDLATTGPSVTKTLVAGQKVDVEVSCWGSHAGSNDVVTIGFMSFAVSGASTQAASDANGAKIAIAKVSPLTSVVSTTVSRRTVFTATGSGSHTFTAKFKSVDGTTNFHFVDRRIEIKPF